MSARVVLAQVNDRMVYEANPQEGYGASGRIKATCQQHSVVS